MARTRKYKIDGTGAERLVLSWTGMWKNVDVQLDGASLGEPIPNFAALKQGREYRLPDGRTLNVRFKSGLMGNQGLEVMIDGAPVPGSDFDPRQRLKLAVGILGFVAGLSALLGALGMAKVAFIQALGFGWPSLAAGVVLGILAFVGAKTRHPAAFVVALALIVVDTVMSLMAIADAGGRFPMGGIYLRVAIIVGVAGGIKAAIDSKKADRKDLVETFR
ncbi:MAG: hypothetical protein U1F43_16090 [Myxococcota bacterium]